MQQNFIRVSDEYVLYFLNYKNHSKSQARRFRWITGLMPVNIRTIGAACSASSRTTAADHLVHHLTTVRSRVTNWISTDPVICIHRIKAQQSTHIIMFILPLWLLIIICNSSSSELYEKFSYRWQTAWCICADAMAWLTHKTRTSPYTLPCQIWSFYLTPPL